MNTVKSIADIKNRISEACQRSGRNSDDVQLIAVSKTLPVDVILEAYNSGLRIFGESRAQEVKEKTSDLPDDINWHFIGHLQTNKIKYVLPVCTLIHSVDSLHLAKAISDFCVKRDIPSSILLEINTSGEISKLGINSADAIEQYLEIRKLKNLNLKGLMTIAPYTNDENLIRQSFRLLKDIRDNLYKKIGSDQKLDLSMGMSQDYEIAIEEGSTMIRIGTAIFGPRGR